jgi:hypothetical protein
MKAEDGSGILPVVTKFITSGWKLCNSGLAGCGLPLVAPVLSQEIALALALPAAQKT